MDEQVSSAGTAKLPGKKNYTYIWGGGGGGGGEALISFTNILTYFQIND